MSFYDEPFTLDNERAKTVLKIALKGFAEKKPMRTFLATIGIDPIDIEWEGTIRVIWPSALEVVAKSGKLRQFLIAVRDAPDYTLYRADVERIIADCDAEAESETKDGLLPAAPVDHTTATIIGRRPFVDRVNLRENLKSLFNADGDKVLIVNGPPSSGRSYTWVLISYVAKKTSGFDTRLIDLSMFSDTQATPVDVARMIAATFGWPPPEVDETAMDATNARVLRPWIAQHLSEIGKVCLVFDGLDGANVAETTLEFIGSIASAAGNDELGECRIVLLAFDRALSNPNVDPFVRREPTLASIPLKEIVAYFRTVAAERGDELSLKQAKALTVTLFGKPPPDPLPMSTLHARAAEFSTAACALRGY
ncbi:hypothetical protein ACH3VR_07405 [Microbacterium sp. B2969]|uniref:NACHT domain-containing protein n=1 Tax=Microbacterium alkaliflavum TaxID=3248839 RepID=A0ABW7Q5P0_9MICO